MKLKFSKKSNQAINQVSEVSSDVEHKIEHLFFRKLNKLVNVRRFVLSWSALSILLISMTVIELQRVRGLYTKKEFVGGGVFIEGVLGEFTTANPIYANNGPDIAVSKLLHTSLYTRDDNGLLTPQVAESFSVDALGKTYIIKLRPDIKFQDGDQLDADDIIYTIKTIQSPSAKSVLYNSWTGAVATKIDQLNVSISLPNTLTSFPESLTFGILPVHIFGNIEVAKLRSGDVNTSKMIGSGPFKIKKIEVYGNTVASREEKITLEKNDQYHLANIQLDGIIIRAIKSEDALFQELDNGTIDGYTTNKEPSPEINYKKMLTSSSKFLYMNNSGVLGDLAIRNAIGTGVDFNQLSDTIYTGFTRQYGPISSSSLGYDRNLYQTKFDITAANSSLDKAGWIFDQTKNVRIKDGLELKLKIAAKNDAINTQTIDFITKNLAMIGIKIDDTLPSTYSDEDFETGPLTRRDYDLLINSIELGYDPDVYIYWHSAMTDPRSPIKLNYAEYKSQQADRALEAGRTRSDDQLRLIKYRPFLETWANEKPAIGLVRNELYFVVKDSQISLPRSISASTDRYNRIAEWKIVKADKYRW